MSSQGYQKPWPIQSLQALKHSYDDQSTGFEVLSLCGELYENDNKQCHVGFDTKTSVKCKFIKITKMWDSMVFKYTQKGSLTFTRRGSFENSGQESMCFFKSRSRYSKTRYNLLSLCTTSCNLTMFPCCISFKSEISLIAVLGTPSSSCSRRIFFKAIVSLVTLSRAL